jgi:uncharacterized protein involved in exopolysaccharide biosynthesis
VLAAAAGGALAYLVMQTQPRVYQASATVIVGPSLTAENPDYTRVGTIDLDVSRVRDGSSLPSLLDPRRRTEGRG